VTIQGDFLLINGVRGDTPERRAYHQMEIPFGKFSIGVELPADVNTKNATMKYQDGFMTITLPKKKLVK
jgi:HSP20 family molecular chaperone IbpA